MSRSPEALETVPHNFAGVNVERVETFRVEVIDGPDRGASAHSTGGRLLVGRAEDATLRLTDPTVSQFHLELEKADGAVIVRDLGSANGTMIHGMTVRDATLRGPVELSLGASRVRVLPGDRSESVTTSTAKQFYGMTGASAAMRSAYARLQAVAPTSSTVLLLGECGTGKELAARAVHEASPRAEKAFELVDCGGMPSTLIESELFGHVKGAFTGAWRDKAGAFERADGGSIFLDELGELPAESQPKLLRVLESGQLQRVGDTRYRKVDVRVVAATNRDLRADVNVGRFRADLYYRLAVFTVRMPPLRERMEDLPVLAAALISRLRQERGIAGELPVDAALLDALRAHSWPGNVRELRNYLEEWLVLQQRPERVETSAEPPDLMGALGSLARVPLREARETFDRAYLVALLERHDWQIIESAAAAGIDRATLFRLMRRHTIERPG